MFGGFGLRIDGLTIGILADLGQGERLWLKAGPDTRSVFEAAGCERFTYQAKGKEHSMGYYSVPDEAMAPWARLALDAALAARQAKPKAARKR